MDSSFITQSRVLMIFMFFSTLSIRPCLAADILDPKKFGQTLSTLAIDGLGTNTLQEAFDKLQFIENPVDGNAVIQTLAISISDKFKERFKVAQRLKVAVENSWTTSPRQTPTECCNVQFSSGLEYDSRFRSKVDLSRICVKISENAETPLTHVADSVVEEMKSISKDYPVIKWQYFASEKGVLANFPAFEDKTNCGSYDPRFRPFYVETATPEPKDVVVVIDHSGSMRGSRLVIAKEAAKTVLTTMNPRDRIGVVKFSDEASTPVEYDNDGRGCHGQRLATATPINIKYLESYVDSITAEGGTFYAKALNRAFDLFKGSSAGSDSSRKKVIIFLTDGVPTDDKTAILETIKRKNEELNNSVVILTYGMLQNLPILQYIADQQGLGVTRAPDVTVGEFTYVANTKKLRSDMATYYDFFSSNTVRNEPIISIPYIDAFGTGLLTSITLPCYHQGKFIGVVGTDISMADLLSEVTYFQKGQLSYAWMADSSGRTMMHPLLPAPSNAFVDPIFMDITALEPEPDFNMVFQSIKIGASGSKSFSSKRYLARGGQIKEGVTVLDVPSTYYWRPVDKTNFTVGIVVADGDKDEMLTSQSIPAGFKFLYHRLDLLRPNEPCIQFSRYASKDTTVVKFGAEAFTDPYTYLGLDEKVSRVKAYKSYMTSTRAVNPGFKPGIRDTVVATRKVDDIWLQEKAAYTKYLVWRYFGTSNGVFRITPGILLAKSYDPTRRPWYHAALRNTGLVALSTPYIDAFGAGVVITAAHTIYRGEASHKHSTDDHVIGVMGADFPLTYFQKLLTDTYPNCEESNYECFVLDGAGFLIMHKDFLSPDITAKKLEYIHITAKEKEIAEDLIQKGHLVKKQCRNLEKINTENFYELSIPFQGVNTLATGQRCRQYQISTVTGSNAFIGVKKRDSSCPVRSCITCGNNRECSKVPVSTCECPCISRLDFHYCRNEFPVSNGSICPVPATVVASEEVNDPSVKGLKKCFDPQCDKKLDSNSCDGVVGCYWCVRDKHDAPLDKKYCADINSCYGGREGTRAPGSGNIPVNGDDDGYDSSKGGLSGGQIAGIVIGVIAAIVVIAVIAVKCHNKERTPKRNLPVQPVPAPAPSSMVYNPPPQPYTVPYGPEPGISMQPTNMPPPSYSWAAAPPSYDQAQPSAPPYNPHYKGSFR